MFEISEQLMLEQSDEIFGVSQISWESSPWKQLSLANDEEVISISHAKVHRVAGIYGAGDRKKYGLKPKEAVSFLVLVTNGRIISSDLFSRVRVKI